jgi:threo-3-hydroxy-L-aspartate ammonia-lyase
MNDNPAQKLAVQVSYADVAAAAGRLQGIAHRTPVATSRQADELAGARVFFKCENLQRIGAFKFRGAYNAVSLIPDADRGRGVVTHSSGNHAQAIALASKLAGIPAVIVMPHDAPASKLAATRGYGAEIVGYDRNSENREEIAERIARERGMTLIPPFDHPHVVAGQGTAAKELIEDAGPLDYLFVCLGGGGLLAGCAVAAHQLAPVCKVIGVEPEAGNDGQQSFRQGAIVEIPVPDTIADGARTTHVGAVNLGIMLNYVSDVITVSDAELVSAMRFFASRMKVVVEPTGCLAAAAVFGRKLDIAGKRVGVLISGGNVDLPVFAKLIAG